MTPFFEFALMLVIPGALLILLTALLLTRSTWWQSSRFPPLSSLNETTFTFQLPYVDRRQRRACTRIRRVRLSRTDDPDDADRRRFYKVEKWDAAELHVEALLHASNDLRRARAVFATEKKRRPRGRYLLRQNIRVLDRWPPHGA
jgi:hypothetical protein